MSRYQKMTILEIVRTLTHLNTKQEELVKEIDECYAELDRRDQIPTPREIRIATWVPHDHAAVQHRDGKEPWCNVCHKTEDGSDPVSKIGIYPPGYKGSLDE